MRLPKTARRIRGSKDYIDVDGTVYTYRSNYHGIKTDTVVAKTQRQVSGYMYCGIYDNETHKCRQRRVHRLVAEAFIPNPEGLPIVGHRNNIKTDNRVENLYWTTTQENIRKAHADGLCEQASGRDDSQSKPVVMFDTMTNERLGEYGSIKEASRETGIPSSTIGRQARYHRPVRKPWYFRFEDDETVVANRIVGQYEYDTDRLVGTFYNSGDAARKTGRCERTICQQLSDGKPKNKREECYFAYVTSKCEQTIESEKRVE